MRPTSTPLTDGNPTGYPAHDHEHVLRQNTRLLHDLDNCQDKLNTLRERLRDLKATPSQPTFAAVVAASGDRPLTRRDPPAPPASSSASKKPMPAKQQAAPASTAPATQVAGSSSDARTALMSVLSLYAPKPVISRLLRASQRNDLSG